MKFDGIKLETGQRVLLSQQDRPSRSVRHLLKHPWWSLRHPVKWWRGHKTGQNGIYIVTATSWTRND